jgi:hypothetical protein
MADHLIVDTFGDINMDTAELSTISNVLTFDDLLIESPDLAEMSEEAFAELDTLDSPTLDEMEDSVPAMREEAFAELGTIDFSFLNDMEEVEPSPIRQDSLFPSVSSESPMQHHETQMRDLLTSLELNTLVPGQQDVPTCIDPSILQEFDVNSNRPDPFALPEVAQTLISTSLDYETLPLPPLPLFSNLPRPVLQQDDYDMLPSPPLPLFSELPPPVPAQDNFNTPTSGALYSTDSLHSHLMPSHFQQQVAYYPTQPLTSVPITTSGEVEEVALNRQEGPEPTPKLQYVEAGSLMLSSTGIRLPPQPPAASSSHDLDMSALSLQNANFEGKSSTQARRATNKLRAEIFGFGKHRKQQITGPMKGPIKISLAAGMSHARFTAAVGTAEANAGTSDYAPLKQRLTTTAHKPRRTTTVRTQRKKRKQPLKGPITITLNGEKRTGGERLGTTLATAEASAAQMDHALRWKPKPKRPVNRPLESILKTSQTTRAPSPDAQAASNSDEEPDW